ncbi:MAG TPA: methyl-accepting chemotaxis protein, partial [Pyrinomonadaceae bacterium]|nr:methyl-accepting chemotaxis protein [Pyrinomonadaceae bacterium]
SPIEKVSLLAKSLERGVLTSLPRTSGSSETDELLQTLHRSNQQLQNLVNLMDKVASGDLNVALAPLQSGDRLSNSFQKLLAKVSESIHAQQNLEHLQAAITQLTRETAPVKNGKLDIEIKSDFTETKEIAEIVKYLLRELNILVTQIRTDSEKAQISASEAQKALQNVIQKKELKVQQLNQAKLALKKFPNTVQKISEDLSHSSVSAGQSIERARRGIQTAEVNLNAVSGLRKQIQEIAGRVHRLNERSQEMGKIAKAVEDLAHRTNLIALNATVQSWEGNRGSSAHAEEIERLAIRSGETNKQISSLNKTMSAEIMQIERLLEAGVGEISNLSRFIVETGSTLSEIERYTGKFLNLQEHLTIFSGEQSLETEQAFEAFIASIGETEETVESLKESNANLSRLNNSVENLQAIVAGFDSGAQTALPVTTDANNLVVEI